MKVARDGQHSGNESTAFEKLVPCLASSLRTFGIFARSAADWSSVITTRMLGRPSFASDAGRAPAGAGGGRAPRRGGECEQRQGERGDQRPCVGASHERDRTLRVTRCQQTCYA